MHKWQTQNVKIKLVDGLCEPYQSLSSASITNGIINLLESIAEIPDRQVAKTGKSSTF